VYSDLWNCRFLGPRNGEAVTHAQTVALQDRITSAGFDVVKTEGLYNFDGKRGYSLGQGE
jgi:isocitrate dehydrogenase